jgi:predicted unusual protein kinase regulating ubiquinone biosynthesis (AarF/ABC1/UbiB family)
MGGTYVVVKVLKPGTYKLANEDSEELTNTWNIQQLRHSYP